MYPALAAAEAMVKQYPDVSLSFVGTVGGFERPLVEHAGVHFDTVDEVQAGPVHGVNPLRLASSVFKLAVGTFQAFGLLARRRPAAILSTGGWASLSVALAAWVRRIPLMIYLPDIEPGLTIRVLRRLARRVAVTVEESTQYFGAHQVIVTGYPLRQDVKQATREEAYAHFGLDPAKKTVLVFGGSRGARAINIAVGDILSQILQSGVTQVIHITGTLDWERLRAQVGSLMDHPDYHAYDYLHGSMGLAYAAADLAVCRAGASVLGEFPYFGLPSILIPLAYTWHYQQVNAEYMASQGAAVHLDESRMEDLLPTIQKILNDPVRLASMQSRARALDHGDGAVNVARELMRLAGGTA
ncbi:MAG: UDP-N-acetylglucosamine--N-acetylmuramyl-(pentapeptide) pyrophosphoryl-undecaprenol N-acetylglucosamine transferase [Chloroflexota bacterium]